MGKWFEVNVEVDDRFYNSFIVFADNEEEAEETIAVNEPQDYECSYSTISFTAGEYEGNTETYDKDIYYLVEV